MSVSEPGRVINGAGIKVATLTAEVLLLAFHLTFLACVARCILKREPFANGAFFKIFIMKSLVDCFAYASVSAISTLPTACLGVVALDYRSSANLRLGRNH